MSETCKIFMSALRTTEHPTVAPSQSNTNFITIKNVTRALNACECMAVALCLEKLCSKMENVGLKLRYLQLSL